MKRALITGVNGFVGKYLKENLLNNGYEVWGGTRGSSPSFLKDVNIVQLDYSNQDSVKNQLNSINPDVIFHLSGQSSVKYSWDHIGETFDSNVMDSISLFNSIRNSTLLDKVKVISIGSSEEYGQYVSLPIVETSITKPINPYGISKLTIANLAMVYNKAYGLDVIHARPFNHIGPGQKLGFVTSDFAKQIVDIEKGSIDPIINVGDLSSKRDFTDVRDIVEAYRLLYEKGEYGEIYNICSGNCVSIQNILDILISYCNKEIQVVVDESRIRPNNIKEYYGSNSKIKNTCKWYPKIKLQESLYDIYRYWLQR